MKLITLLTLQLLTSSSGRSRPISLSSTPRPGHTQTSVPMMKGRPELPTTSTDPALGNCKSWDAFSNAYCPSPVCALRASIQFAPQPGSVAFPYTMS